MHICASFNGQIGKIVGRSGQRDIPARTQTGQRARGRCLNIRVNDLQYVARGAAQGQIPARPQRTQDQRVRISLTRDVQTQIIVGSRRLDLQHTIA